MGICHGSFGYHDRGFCIVSPSRPGFGRTPLSSGKSAADHAKISDALMTEVLGVEKYVVLGGSGAGPVGLQMALLFPERVKALLLVFP